MTTEDVVSVQAVNIVADGDVLVQFSNGTTVLFHAKFLHDMRHHDGNVQIVDPFE